MNNTGVFFEILGMVVFAMLLAVLTTTRGWGDLDSDKAGSIFAFPGFEFSFFLVAMFMSLYVMHGFDTASTLAEETHNPRREAPRRGARIRGGCVRDRRGVPVGMPVAVPDMGEAVAGFFGPTTIITAVASETFQVLYLFVVVASIFVCCLAVQTSTIRLAFGMARDNQLPLSKSLAKVNPRVHTPVATCIIIGLLMAIPFIQFAGASTIAVGATASIYFSYLLGNLAFMRARTRGWPRTKAPFSLGGWGKVVNVIAILWERRCS